MPTYEVTITVIIPVEAEDEKQARLFALSDYYEVDVEPENIIKVAAVG